MADLKFDLDWDTVNGELVAYVSVTKSGVELASLNLGPEVILDSFYEDVEEAEKTNDDSLLTDWDELSKTLSSVSDAINQTIEQVKTRREDFMKNLLENGMNV